MIAELLLLKDFNNIVLAPQSFIEASDFVRKKVCNGAGTKGLNVPDSFLGVSITPAADIHDWMYFEARTMNDKRFADFVFLVNMVQIIVRRDHTRDNFWNRRKLWLRLKMAILYFVSVWRWGSCEGANMKMPLWERVGRFFRRLF